MKIHFWNVVTLLKQWLGGEVEINEQDLHHEEGRRRLVEKLREVLNRIIKDKLPTYPYPTLLKRRLKNIVESLIEKLQTKKH